ncbi:hypothetical protein EYF80_044421 [Liparis tanakae]|uniref:Uncharacterized protein n=1 Tax=Liparis tanakae TaxID=230148 RepID=A0A4Z2FWR6_9TELE|nr:hypothetical protein EYF80_044421 [Liparis tanakae]
MTWDGSPPPPPPPRQNIPGAPVLCLNATVDHIYSTDEDGGNKHVEERRLGVVRWSDGGDLVVLVPGSISTAGASAAAAAAAALTCVALRERQDRKWDGGWEEKERERERDCEANSQLMLHKSVQERTSIINRPSHEGNRFKYITSRARALVRGPRTVGVYKTPPQGFNQRTDPKIPSPPISRLPVSHTWLNLTNQALPRFQTGRLGFGLLPNKRITHLNWKGGMGL